MKKSTSLRTAACVSLAAVLACGCAAQSAASGSASSPASSATEGGQTETAASSQTAAAGTEAPLYNSAKLDDGQLRLLDSYSTTLGAVVLRGGEVLCEASPTDTLYLIEDSLTGQMNYYLYSWSDASSPSGRRSAVCDALGTQILSFDESVRVSLMGNYLVVYSDTSAAAEYDLSAPNTVRVFDISTASDGRIRGEIAVPENTVDCAVAGDYFAFTIYHQPEGVASIYADDEQYTHCTVQIQDREGNVVFEDSSCAATAPYGSDTSLYSSWILLRYYEGSDWGAQRSALYRPADGKYLDNYEQNCGSGTACFKVSTGVYQLLDITGGSTALLGELSGSAEYYVPGYAVLWQPDYSYALYDLATGESVSVQSVASFQGRLALLTTDNELRVFDSSTGEELLSQQIEFDGGAENGCSASFFRADYLWVQKYGGANGDSEIKVCGLDGSVVDITPILSKYTYVSDLAIGENGPLLAGMYDGPGGSTLYDVLDCSGNVLIHGLAACYTPSYSSDMPQGVFYAQRGFYCGWMDENGEWLYCRSIFSTLQADDESYDYFY